MNKWRVIFISILSLIFAVGGYIIGRHTAERKISQTRDILSVQLSEESEPERGLYLVSFKNQSRHMCYFSANLSFTLKDDADGFQVSYISSSHSEFVGYALAPHTTIDLQALISAGEGFLEFKHAGQLIYPSAQDTIYLSVLVRVWELHNGTCQELSLDFPVKTTPLKNFMDSDLLSNKKEEYLNQSTNLDKLPPLNFE